MSGFILGEKSVQSQRFTEEGVRIPTTFIATPQCYVVEIMTPEKNGYFAVLLGSGKLSTIKKSVHGKTKKAGIETPLRYFKEVRLDMHKDVVFAEVEGKPTLTIGETTLQIGDVVTPSLFKSGDMVKVTGVSKGKGFQGVVKRHGFAGGPRTHGQSDRERAPGSIGQTTTPGRVYKGKRMAGHMGTDTVTVRGLQVVEVTENGLYVKGLVPGGVNGLLQVETL